MKTTDFIKQTGVNYDYILGLRLNGKYVEVVEYDINRHEKEIDRALKLLNDENADVCDVYNAIKWALPNSTYDYCFGHEYSDRYIKEIKPVESVYYELKKEWREKFDAEVEYLKFYLSKNERSNWKKINEIEKKAKENLSRFIHRQKAKLISIALPSIYAYDYESALIQNNIKENCIVFSNEKHGDNRDKLQKRGYHVEHRVNEDLSIKVETNFCYGTSTYFGVVVIYKGIKLVPYSVWVSYYYAGYSQLLKYTKAYKRERNNWHSCMNFLEDFINSAIEDPDSFIRGKVMHEIKTFINGLENIFLYGEKEIEDKIRIKPHSDDKRYIDIIDVKDANENDEIEYSINPSEVTMIYKMEKISGALRFINSLQELNVIYSEIESVINRIKEMNRTVLPDVENAIPPILEEKKKLESEFSPKEKELKICEISIEKFQRRLLKIQDKMYSSEERKKSAEDFRLQNPQFVELEKKANHLRVDIRELKDKINKRERVLCKLKDSKELILKYTKQ